MATEDRSTLREVVSWGGGIAAAVLTAVLIAHFTGSSPSPAPTPASSPPVTLDLDGLIVDSTTHAPVNNATLSVTLGTYSGHQRTGPDGKYRIILNEPVAQAAMSDYAISAPGYQPAQNTIAVTPPATYAIIQMDATPSPSLAPINTPDAHAITTQAKILVQPFPPDYVRGTASLMSREATARH